MIVKHAVINILDKDAGNVINSDNELDLTQSGLHEYIEKIVGKAMSGTFKQGIVTGDSYLGRIGGDDTQKFTDKAAGASDKLFDIIGSSEDIPSGVLMIVEYAEGTDDYLAIIKLNYTDYMGVVVDGGVEGVSNNLAHNQALPNQGTRPENAVILNLMTGEYKLIEKSALIDGHRANYFSERFLELETERNTDETIKEIKRAAKSVADKYGLEEYETLAKLQEAVYNDAGDGGRVDTDKLSGELFNGNESAKMAFSEALSDHGIEKLVEIDEPARLEKKYGNQKFKLSSGVEVSIPMDVYQDRSKVEFINNPDGTVTLMLKGEDAVMSKF